MKKQLSVPGLWLLGRAVGSHTGPFIHPREGREMGARSLAQHPTGSCQTCWLQQQERISQVWTHKYDLAPHLLFRFSLLPAAPHILQAVSANNSGDTLFSTHSRKAEKSSCQVWHCKELPMRALHTPKITKVIWHHNISAPNTQLLEGQEAEAAKQPGMGKTQVLREKWMTKSCSIQGSALRKVNHQSCHSLLRVPQKTQILCLVCSSAWKQNPKRTFSDNSFKMLKLISPCLVWFWIR